METKIKVGDPVVPIGVGFCVLIDFVEEVGKKKDYVGNWSPVLKLKGKWYYASGMRHATPLEVAKWKIMER